ncbi:MAG TPA: hypothetical protein ENN55_03930 [Firmicutes bacterium]|nr:hypothetical protein [Bacillota bacterium]
MTESVFDGIAGIGEKTKNRIYRDFRDADELAAEIMKNSEKTAFLSGKQKKALIDRLKSVKGADE